MTCLGESDWPLFVTGGVGSGKTCAGLALLDYSGGKYWTSTSLVRDAILAMKRALPWNNGEGQSGTMGEEQFHRMIERAPMVVLDELGMRGVSDHHYETIKTLLELRAFKPLMVISNVSLEKISEIFDERVFSRLACGTIVDIHGHDKRLE